MTAERDGEIVTFYSYKGGTGRTMALANIAWILAANGGRVLAVDWDLEAPGLHKFFSPFIDQTVLETRPGLLNLILDYSFQARDLGPDRLPPGDDDPWFDQFVRFEDGSIPVNWDFPGGALDLLPAGRLDRTYTGSYSSFDWNFFHESLRGMAFFRALRRRMKQRYDWVLVDSRTGLSDAGDICTALIPDTLVNCFTMSEQSIEGAAMVAQRIARLNQERTIRILPVPMRLEIGEKERLDIGRATAQQRFDMFLVDRPEDERNRYWRSVEVPYVPYYSYEEILAVFGDLPDTANSVLGAFERVTAELSRGEVVSLPPMAEDLRRHHLSAFQRPRPAPPADLVLSYVPEDRLWADWIMAILLGAGFRVSRRSETASDRAAERARPSLTRTLVVLSRAYERSDECRAIEAETRLADPIGNQRLVVPVGVGGPSYTNPFPARGTVALDQLDEEAAVKVVLGAVGGEPSAAPRAPSASGGRSPRFPGSNPPVWRVPARNGDFTGRAQLLEALRDRLLDGGSAALLQVLHGLGGVGKTQIALEYAHRFKADYDIAWWIPAEEPNRAAQLLADLAFELKVRDRSAKVEDAAVAVVEHLRDGGPGRKALLIYDNIEVRDNFDVLRSYIPTGGAAHVLITSRDRAPATELATTALDVNVFSRDESIAYLQAHVPHLADADADRLAEQLGDLPIVVELAAAWLRETGRSAAGYSKALAEDPEIVLSEASGTYKQPVSAVWRATIEQLRERSPAAVRMLELCAFFGADPIAEDIIYSQQFVSTLKEHDPLVGDDRMMVDRLVRQLTRFALARVDHVEKGVQVHRLLQSLVRDGMAEPERDRARLAVQRILADLRPSDGDVEDPENRNRYQILWPHLYACGADVATTGGPRQLMIDRVRFLSLSGFLDRALDLAERMADTWATASPPEDMWLLALRFEIANAKRLQGDAAAALTIDEEVLVLQRANPDIGPTHLHTLRTAGSLAADLRSLGRWREALDLDRGTYATFVAEYGETQRRTLDAGNNLALSLLINGRTVEARNLQEQVFRTGRQTLGKPGSTGENLHPRTLHFAMNLGRHLRACGQLHDSLLLLQTTTATCQRELGDEHPVTLRAAKSLAVTERRLGRLEDARRRTELALPRFERVLGTDAPETLACLLNRGADLSAAGDKAGARDLAARLHQRYVDLFGTDHPHALACANNLAIYLRTTGKVAEAIGLAGETRAAMDERLGPEHPFTLAAATNLANALSDAGHHDDALAVSEATCDRLAETLGANHPETLDATANRAVILRRADRAAEAEELRRRTLDAMIELYDDRHHNPAALLAWRLLNRDLEPHST